jgi:hypothetical protein
VRLNTSAMSTFTIMPNCCTYVMPNCGRVSGTTAACNLHCDAMDYVSSDQTPPTSNGFLGHIVIPRVAKLRIMIDPFSC